ncbi:MAG: DNA circularization N-terminal domain-containing protein [Hyphomicrobiaceae bacterium]
MTLRDWPKSLRPASFRGASFYVESDQIETGRRLVIHEFPHKDLPYVEDLGRKANKIQVTGYVLGDQADQAEKSLRGACERRGAATLSLPLERLKAHCEDCRRDFAKDKQGHVAFTMVFVRDGSAAGPFPAAFLADLVRTDALAIRIPLAGMFLARFATLTLPGFVRDAAAVGIRDVATTLDIVARALPLDSSKGPPLFRAIQSIYSNAETLADVGARGDRYADRTYVQEAETRLEAGYVTAVADVLSGLREAAAAVDVITAFEPLLTYELTTEGPAITAGRQQEATNAAAIASVVRIEALGQYASAVVSRPYTDRRTAIQARADAAERFDAELARLAGWRAHEISVTLDGLRGRTVEHLTREITDLAPVLSVGSEVSMPSLWWAFRLYGDATRAGELAERNRIKHPSFMPLEFEALAR